MIFSLKQQEEAVRKVFLCSQLASAKLGEILQRIVTLHYDRGIMVPATVAPYIVASLPLFLPVKGISLEI